jgi:signal transduction histidine kinase
MSFPAGSNCNNAASDPLVISPISRELHQTAQPLTVLQGLLELALLRSHTAEEYRNIIERAMEESRRVSGCFDHVRELVQLEEDRPGRERGKVRRSARLKEPRVSHV